jgi:hypothetical protein
MSLPYLTIDKLINENVYSMGLAKKPEKWQGKLVAIERDVVIAPNTVEIFSDIQIIINGANLQTGENVSIIGYYNEKKIYPKMIYRHTAILRDLFSYVALLIFLCVWFNFLPKINSFFIAFKKLKDN